MDEGEVMTDRETKSKYTAPGMGSDGKHYVSGPGSGMDYDSGTLYPEMRFSTQEDAVAGAKCANEAYRQGYLRAKEELREWLGVKRG